MTDTRTRRPAPVERPVVLTVAGSDSGGGAGIQADLKTIEATGGFGTSALTAVTAQNTTGVASSFVLPVEEVRAQIEAVRADFDVRAAKTGMLATSEVIGTVAEYAADMELPLVVDPVMVAASGDRLLTPEGEAAYEDLLAEATLVTPNADEAAVLTGVEVTDEASARRAGERLLETGADAALLKGGHLDGNTVRDALVTADGVETTAHPRVDTDATHGSGCTLSAAVATRLARGEGLRDAVAESTAFVARAIRYHHAVGAGPGAVHHLVDLRDEAARERTVEAVETVVARFTERNVRPLVPDGGMAVVGATPYAEAETDVAAVEGRLARTVDGVRSNRGVRFGAAAGLDRFLLGARERHPELRFAAAARFDERVAAALDAREVAEFDREPDESEFAAGERAFDRETPTAVVLDRGGIGREPRTVVVARDPAALVDRVLGVLDAVRAAERADDRS